MSISWRISDLIDLNWLLSLEPVTPGHNGEAETAGADRAVYLSYEKGHTPPYDRGELIRYWLDEKRAVFFRSRPLPGELYDEVMSLARILGVVAAFLIGSILAWSILSYSGGTPINIFTCVWIMIVPQLLLLSFLGLSTLLSRPGGRGALKGFYPVTAMFLRRLAARAKKNNQNSPPISNRKRLITLFDLANRRNTFYGPVLLWSFFVLTQLIGVWFNLGLLTATGLKLAITDLAFGWQSTLFPDPATVFTIVDGSALPWSWAVTDAHPTLSQVAGSRMILKEGIVHLATPDLVSWWPFLIYAIICYGLIPRILLLTWGYWKQHRTLAAISFSTGACDRLLQRMQTPGLQRSVPPGSDQSSAPLNRTSPAAMPAAPERDYARSMGPGIALIPEEIVHLFAEDVLRNRIAAALGLNMTARIPLEQNAGVDITTLKHLLEEIDTPPEELRLVVVTEAWQPPLRETLSWLAGLRQAAGPHTGLIVGLVGKPQGNNRFTAPGPVDRTIWEQAIKSLNDPFIRIESLGDGHE